MIVNMYSHVRFGGVHTGLELLEAVDGTLAFRDINTHTKQLKNSLQNYDGTNDSHESFCYHCMDTGVIEWGYDQFGVYYEAPCTCKTYPLWSYADFWFKYAHTDLQGLPPF